MMSVVMGCTTVVVNKHATMLPDRSNVVTQVLNLNKISAETKTSVRRVIYVVFMRTVQTHLEVTDAVAKRVSNRWILLEMRILTYSVNVSES